MHNLWIKIPIYKLVYKFASYSMTTSEVNFDTKVNLILSLLQLSLYKVFYLPFETPTIIVLHFPTRE